MRKFNEIEAWVFDLDNTLYPLHHNLFEQVDKRMTAFIQTRWMLTATRPISCKKAICANSAPALPG